LRIGARSWWISLSSGRSCPGDLRPPAKDPPNLCGGHGFRHPALEAGALKEDQTQRLTSVSAANRIALWQIAWENFRQHPLTGTGGDTYQLIFEQNRPANFPQSTKYPHSVWLSLLSDTGIFSFLAFAAFSVGCLCLAFYNALSTTRTTKSRALVAGSAAALTAYLASSTIDWNWYIPASTLPFFALAAVAAGTTLRRRQRNEEQPAAR
jgi:O-antigen ligase